MNVSDLFETLLHTGYNKDETLSIIKSNPVKESFNDGLLILIYLIDKYNI